MARIHIAAAGGLSATALLIPVVVLSSQDNAIPAWGLRVAALIALCGGLLDIRRRAARPSDHLAKGAWSRFPGWIAVFSTGVIISTLPGQLSWLPGPMGTLGSAPLAALLCLVGLLGLLTPVLFDGPMKHAVAGAAHLAFHPRPRRFGSDKPASDLLPLDLEMPRLGVETPADFAWNRLLGFDACVQCGRCETACPAFAAGQPLNPKKLIQDLVVGMSGPGSDANYAGSPHPGQALGESCGEPHSPIVPNLIAAQTLWSCTTCRACVEVCPMFIEHVDAIVDMRRFQALERGSVPAKAADAIENLRLTDNPNGCDPGSRMDWAVDLALPLLAEVGQCDVLLWCADAAFERRNQRSLRALVKLLRAAAVDFAVLGNEEADCGDLARRLGDEATFQALARRNIETLSRYRFNRIVTADPHAYHVLRNEYPALGGRFEVMHHTGYLGELARRGRLPVTPLLGATVTYHDPCYLARYNGETDAPRFLLERLGVGVVEMARSGMGSRCCGGGGGAALCDVPGEARIPDLRIDDVRETGAATVVVACPNCMTMLEGVVRPRPEVVDIAELLAAALREEIT